MLPVMYHGTTRRRWNSKDNGSTSLYLTSSRQDAENYADEAASNEAYDHKNVEAVVVVFQPETLLHLANTKGLEINPDWGWVDGLEATARHIGQALPLSLTWQDSLVGCQGICISGFKDSFKVLAVITPLLDDSQLPKPEDESTPHM